VSREDFPTAILTSLGLGIYVAMARYTKGGWQTYCEVRR
jgi:hypothetical protein